MNSSQSNGPTRDSLNGSIDINQILIAEFEYAASTASQNNEDRARVTSFFFVAVGSLAAAIFGADSIVDSDNIGVRWAFVVLFSILSAVGLLTVAQLSKLRKAWFDSVETMNRIKDFYVSYSGHQEIDQAFRWKTLPPLVKLRSVSFILVLEVSLLSGAMLGSAVIFFGLASSDEYLWTCALVFGALFVSLSLLIYVASTRK
ncbi:MAG TPA: hypothetical protein VL334_26570 [Anaerolineae bacterium]|nr:hypothetical protein [Anaerolineae bacterium]